MEFSAHRALFLIWVHALVIAAASPPQPPSPPSSPSPPFPPSPAPQEAATILWPPAGSLVSAASIREVGFRIEFSSLHPGFEYGAEATWRFGEGNNELSSIVSMGARLWPLDVAHSERSEALPGTVSRASVLPDEVMLMLDEWFEFMADTGRTTCSSEQLTLTVRLNRLHVFATEEVFADQATLAATASLNVSAFGYSCPGKEGEVRSERILHSFPPHGQAITSSALHQTGYVARLDYLHRGGTYAVHLQVDADGETQSLGPFLRNVEPGKGDVFVRLDLPLLSAGHHSLSLTVQEQDWGVVARHESFVVVVADDDDDDDDDDDAGVGSGYGAEDRGGRWVIGGKEKERDEKGEGKGGDGWVLDREWCNRSASNRRTCTRDGYRAPGAPFVYRHNVDDVDRSGRARFGDVGESDAGGSRDSAQKSGAREGGAGAGDVPGAEELCGVLKRAGVKRMAFLGDSFAIYHYISTLMLLTGDFYEGALKDEYAGDGGAQDFPKDDGKHPSLHQLGMAECRSWNQYKTACRPKINFGPRLLCGGDVTVAYMRASLDRLGRHPRSVGSFAQPDDGTWDTLVWSEGRHFVHTPMADFDRSVGRGWATVPPEASLPSAGACAESTACKSQDKARQGGLGLEGNGDMRAGALGQCRDTCSSLDLESRAFEGEVTCATMDFSRIRKGVQLTCGPGGYGHSVDRIVYVSGHVQANWIDAVKEHLGTPNIKWKLYDHKLFGLRCCAECSHPDHCPLSAANGVDVGRYIDKEWQRIISSQCPRSSVLDIWRMTEALAKALPGQAAESTHDGMHYVPPVALVTALMLIQHLSDRGREEETD